MRVVWGVIERIVSEDPGIQRVVVRVGGDDACPQAPRVPQSPSAPAGLRRALCYPHLTGRARPGDRVAVNTTACDLRLGTGGWDVVCAVDAAEGAPALCERMAGPGHIMKLRYTPCQVNVASVEEEGSPWHDELADKDDCRGLPVACCELHSQAMAVAAQLRRSAPWARVCYVMTDEAALDLSLSDICRAARARGILDATMTCGQAVGGEHEAVGVHSALLAVDAMGFDAAVVSMGPGIVGTGTRFGHGALGQAEAINACAVVGARAVAPLRASFADARPRHHGLSHHTMTSLGRACLAGAQVAVPSNLPADQMSVLRRQLEESGVALRHRLVDIEVPAEALACLEGCLGEARLTTMGRSVREDPAFFACAAAAGEVLARLACDRRPAGADAS